MPVKHIIVTKLFEFSGSNTHLKALISFFGPQNVLLILEDEGQVKFLEKVDESGLVRYKIKTNLCGYAHLQYRWTTNLKEAFRLLKSVFYIQLLSFRHGLADITVCAVEPEKHLYFFWAPFCKVYYILHTTPNKRYTSFTSYTCNRKLGKRKKIITVSQSNKSLISKNWEITEKKQTCVNVVYNCVTEPVDGVQLNTERYNAHPVCVITMGHVIGYKNPETWLKVAKVVTGARPKVIFIWLGNGPLLNQYQSEISNQKQIFFKGAVTNTDDYLKTAHIYYQPSFYETHGIAVVEAMSQSLPCVVSNVGGLPESVREDYNGYLVEPAAISQHAEAILKLVDNEHLRHSLGENAFTRFKENFSFEQFKTQLNSIYS
ncbi:glycosyltransferase family 4 protein [Mucilaginibacter rubeus]|uniref:Glycosyltransferase family 4 protein n=1 Tax=Mucilaginibacter rubeus TaxID=2027860 RepID=A0A5C1I0K2_9SPHI|nr:glycosyltransferase family 4 protein [Mucilaginibacter rubeus]QEM11414.1 glycosyltransferase family 4 protein [Mucilaginibacter rubeus]